MSNFPEGLLHFSIIHFRAGHAECLTGEGWRLILLILVRVKGISFCWQLMAFLPARSPSCGHRVLPPYPSEPSGGLTRSLASAWVVSIGRREGRKLHAEWPGWRRQQGHGEQPLWHDQDQEEQGEHNTE